MEGADPAWILIWRQVEAFDSQERIDHVSY